MKYKSEKEAGKSKSFFYTTIVVGIKEVTKN